MATPASPPPMTAYRLLPVPASTYEAVKRAQHSLQRSVDCVLLGTAAPGAKADSLGAACDVCWAAACAAEAVVSRRLRASTAAPLLSLVRGRKHMPRLRWQPLLMPMHAQPRACGPEQKDAG